LVVEPAVACGRVGKPFKDTQGPPGCPGLRGAWRRASWDRVAEIQPQDRLGLRPPSLHQSAGAPLSATVRDEAGFTRRSDLIGGLEGNNLVHGFNAMTQHYLQPIDKKSCLSRVRKCLCTNYSNTITLRLWSSAPLAALRRELTGHYPSRVTPFGHPRVSAC
jgi:hypothetical protein